MCRRSNGTAWRLAGFLQLRTTLRRRRGMNRRRGSVSSRGPRDAAFATQYSARHACVPVKLPAFVHAKNKDNLLARAECLIQDNLVMFLRCPKPSFYAQVQIVPSQRFEYEKPLGKMWTISLSSSPHHSARAAVGIGWISHSH